MWPFKEKQPKRKKRTPKEWAIPLKHVVELLGLYDTMISNSPSLLPKYQFWSRLQEIIPETRNYPIRVEASGEIRCIKIVEVVADDDFEPTLEELEAARDSQREEIRKLNTETEKVFTELENKLNAGRPVEAERKQNTGVNDGTISK
ncbi:MAG: hypothetical protein M0R50_08720 [Candidatus Cloacimonetes bacterium]|jgi:hypothetical protein|nr:hypothetical protein [Candidatus Cloacimonadota bacterium]